MLDLNEHMETLRAINNDGVFNPEFKVVLHDPNAPGDLRSGGVAIKPGYTSTFLVTASEVATSASVKDLPFDKRKCKFQSEVEGMKIFKQYSHSACIMECQVNCLTLIESKRHGCTSPMNYHERKM